MAMLNVSNTLSGMLALAGIAFTTALFPAETRAETPKPVSASGEFHPVLVYETGSKDSDQGFTESAHRGAETAHKELSITFEEYRLPENENHQDIIKAAIDNGATMIIAVGFQFAVPVMMLAERYPNVEFSVIDGFVPPIYPNVQSVTFNDNEGAFLVGMIAAATSHTNIIGFVGGMDVPIIRNFFYGYRHGANFVNPHIVVLNDMIGTTAEAWNQPDKAANLANKQFNTGADIIFAAAGGSGVGVLRSAKQNKKLAIGADINQNALYAGFVLTSLVKRVDKAVYDTLKNGRAGTWEPGNKYLGLKEGALDYVVDANNRNLISKELIDRIENTKDQIIRGKIIVDTYTPN